MKFTEKQLREYAEPLSDTEDAMCKHAIEAIRDALKILNFTDDQKAIAPLEADTYAYSIAMRKSNGTDKITIFVQGSYANNTCVKGESDVDIAVVHETICDRAYGKNSTIYFDKRKEALQFKDSVVRALKAKFPAYVERKNKSIKVMGNTYRKQADAVPCLSLRYHYLSDYEDYTSYKDGIVIYADDGEVIQNFPKQHIANGRAKNVKTNHYYKKMVRIIKKMRSLMKGYGYASADGVSSFGLESLLWNLPDEVFMKCTNYCFVFDDVVTYLYQHKESLHSFKEADGIKLLCPTQTEVMKYERFIDSLYRFYEYEL